jgi:hypothetical protein
MADGTLRVASGVDQGIGISKQPAIVESPTISIDFKYSSGSTTSMGKVNDAGPDPTPDCTKDNSCGNRRSWRQLNI